MLNKPSRFLYDNGVFLKLYDRNFEYKYLKSVQLPPFGQIFVLDESLVQICDFVISNYYQLYEEQIDRANWNSIQKCVYVYLTEFLDAYKDNTIIKQYLELPVLERCNMFKKVLAICCFNIGMCTPYLQWEIPVDDEIEKYIINTFGERFCNIILDTVFRELQYHIQPYYLDKLIGTFVEKGILSFKNNKAFQQLLNIILAVIDDRGQIVYGV